MEDVTWLLESGEPWTVYRTLVDLLECSEEDAEVRAARREMLAHPQVKALVDKAATWSRTVMARHNDTKHPVYALTTLADFGLRHDDPGIADAIAPVLAHQAPDGAFQTLVNIPKAFGGRGEDVWTWIVCDAPTVLYALVGLGLGADLRVQRAADHLAGLADDNGWRCRCDEALGRFKGPGSRTDPCPIANVYALKALAAVASGGSSSDLLDAPAAHAGVEMLLDHWARRGQVKYYLFGIGTDFRKLKYPFVWYDLLHVTDVISRYPWAHQDPRFCEMLETLLVQAGDEGRYTATSMYMAWKGWSFADKKAPSPWLTFLARRIEERTGEGLGIRVQGAQASILRLDAPP